MVAQGEPHAWGVRSWLPDSWLPGFSPPGFWLVGCGLLAGCNGILGLDASTLEEGGATSGATASGATTSTSTTSTSTAATTTGGDTTSSGGGGAGGEAASSSSTGAGGAGGAGGTGGNGGGGSDPCGTWGLLENGGFECGVEPWRALATEPGTNLETFTPGYGDRGTAARHRVVGVGNPVYQDLGRLEIAASTCFVTSYAARSSDGSGQVAAALTFLEPPGWFLVGSYRNLGPSFSHHGPLACRIPDDAAGTHTVRFSFTFAGLTDEDTTVAIDAVEVSLVPCAGSEPDCNE